MPRRKDTNKTLIIGSGLMKILTIMFGCVLWATLSYGECVMVTPIMNTTFRMSPEIVVTVLLDGKRAGPVRIDVLTDFNEHRYSLVANEQGVAALPILPPGSYHIVAVTVTVPPPLGEVYLAEINFDVSQSLLNRPSLLNLDLVSANRFWPKSLPVDEASAPRGKPLAVGAVQRFQGSVTDPQGSAIAGASIRIFSQQPSGRVLVAETTADEIGRFSASLGPGAYTASVQMRGFRIRIITFEIAREANTKNLEISLNIGGC